MPLTLQVIPSVVLSMPSFARLGQQGNEQLALDEGAGEKGKFEFQKKHKGNWSVVVGSGNLVSRLRSTVIDSGPSYPRSETTC